MAARIIEHHFGSAPKRITHNASGLSNLVFSVQHSQGDMIVRLSPDQARLNSYLKEHWAITAARKAGVPVPEVLECGNQVVPIPYMVSRKTVGNPAAHHPERLRIVREMGHYAAVINSLKTKGFGSTFEWSHNRLSHNATWLEFLHNELRMGEKLDILEGAGMLSKPLRRKLRTTLENAAGKTRKPALNHGDIRLKNVLVGNTGQIVAILDWETATSNLAPEWELSLALHDLSIDEKHAFIEGYGLAPRKLVDIAPVIKSLNIINYAPEVERLVKAKDTAQLEQTRIRLSGVLDLYSL